MCYIKMDLAPDEAPELTTEWVGNPLSSIKNIDSFVEKSFETITTSSTNSEKQAAEQALPLANDWIN